MMKRMPLHYLFLTMLIGESAQFDIRMISLLTDLIIALIIVVAPLLLLYGFLHGTLDVFKKVNKIKMSLLLLGSALETLDKMAGMLMSVMFLILPFTFILLIWKLFTKVVKL
jgi:hypothetical protein